GVAQDEAVAATTALGEGFGGGEGRMQVVVQLDGRTGRIAWLEARRSDGAGVRLDRAGDRFRASRLALNLTSRLTARMGVMNDQSFYSSATNLLDDRLIEQFTQAMAYDFNFAHDIVPGSQFTAVYEEQIDGGGNVLGASRLVMASLSVPAFHDTHQSFTASSTAERNVDVPAKARKFYLFDPTGSGKPGWYSDAGVSAVRSLMRTPVNATRISSVFGPRMHPILERVIFHKGVDFACPEGSPVYAAADGVILSVADPAHSGGYGNFIKIRHSEHLVTAYAHLSHVEDGVAPGARVTQGQTIALSGNTGNSTGPHLHFEIQVDGTPVDPLSYQTTTTQTLAGAQLAAFKKERDRIDLAVLA
ncbi:MAG TPA: M23 family metallopeptidase, partial [Caulobacteraceae bacterium]|nr:M23 family metallopeptidase [Caulobacteraceae bacterium]